MHMTKENSYRKLADTGKLFLLLFFLSFFLSYLILQLVEGYTKLRYYRIVVNFTIINNLVECIYRIV
jgi:hypothetical protein